MTEPDLPAWEWYVYASAAELIAETATLGTRLPLLITPEGCRGVTGEGGLPRYRVWGPVWAHPAYVALNSHLGWHDALAILELLADRLTPGQLDAIGSAQPPEDVTGPLWSVVELLTRV